MPPRSRKFLLTAHVTVSVGWLGAVVTYLALAVAAAASQNPQTIRSAWIAMELTGWYVIVPLALAAPLTGIVMSLASPWGVIRHFWVLASLGLTALCTTVAVLHMPTVSFRADLARQAGDWALREHGSDLAHPGIGLVLLLVITALNVYKPAGTTGYGRRRKL